MADIKVGDYIEGEYETTERTEKAKGTVTRADNPYVYISGQPIHRNRITKHVPKK